jgi:hypothetical protein
MTCLQQKNIKLCCKEEFSFGIKTPLSSANWRMTSPLMGEKKLKKNRFSPPLGGNTKGVNISEQSPFQGGWGANKIL